MIADFQDIIKLFSRKGRKFYFFLVKTIGYWPRSTEHFSKAFVHRSVSPSAHLAEAEVNNERLEYLGDAVIETIVSDILYHKFPSADEGFLSHLRSNMVCRARLNTISFELGLDEYIVMSSRKDLAVSHIPGDVLEAFVAAIYLDGGMKKAFRFVEKAIANPKRIAEAQNDSNKANYKSDLVCLGEQLDVEVIFETRKATGNLGRDEDGFVLCFVSEIKVQDFVIGVGYGRSKKSAEQMAAGKVLAAVKSGDLDLSNVRPYSILMSVESELEAEAQSDPSARLSDSKKSTKKAKSQASEMNASQANTESTSCDKTSGSSTVCAEDGQSVESEKSAVEAVDVASKLAELAAAQTDKDGETVISGMVCGADPMSYKLQS